MAKLKSCKCGGNGITVDGEPTEHDIKMLNEYGLSLIRRYKVVCDKCKKETQSYTCKEPAWKEWNKINKTAQIKSKKRVQDYGEVFTPAHIVKDMCNLIPSDVWENISSTFLEPCCGNGNFLAEILERKLSRCENAEQGLTALKSIYAIDIQQDNVEESKLRLFDIFIKHFPKAPATTGIEAAAILEHNIICGNSLEIMERWKNNG
ncbi:MAG: N-6 DNA methylase [Oscillospiraceae bacterium]